jgi:tripartite-type tricarboxylate transporter receptor subunit TctC
MKLRFRAALVGLSIVACEAWAQTYPAKPLRLIVADAPGGSSDLRARQVAPKLGEALGQPVMIDNRPGGSMIIAAEMAARAAPDGYTLFLGNVVTHSLNPLVFKSLPYRADRDFVPVTLITSAPLLLAVNPQVAAATLAELVALAKARPNQLQYGGIGRGSPQYLLMEQLNAATGAQFTFVPYKSVSTSVQDLVGGHMPVGLQFWSVIGGMVKSGKLRAIAVAAPRRLEVAPEIPTFAESGVPDVVGYGWQGIFLPAGTPAPIVARLHADLARVFQLQEIRNPIIETGAEPGGNTPAEFASFIRADQARSKKAADLAGLVPE